MTDFKIHVHNSEESTLVQQLMFKLGYKWLDFTPPTVQFTNKPFLYFHSENKGIGYGDNFVYFNCHSFHELTLDQLLDEIEEILTVKDMY